ncbi:MAG: flagellar basal-body rod protein FlgG [Armatimonadetes bacterium]|nr:flagellar basal-body rod protein FlgG [Armatimonadota bacterium]
MMRALYTAASGMMAQQLNIDNISHNLANYQSVGFKKSRVTFEDLLYATMKDPGQEGTPGTQIGMGVRSAGTQRMFAQGTLQDTGNPYDVGIQGEGFFKVLMPDGTEAYTRDGSFKYDGDTGELTTSSGYPIGVKIPKDLTNIEVTPEGEVKGVRINGDGKPEKVGQIKLSRFLNPSGLQATGGNLYVETELAGAKTEDVPGANGLGVLAQGHLEKSNINIVEEMINIVQAQRAFEMNQKGVQAADEMMRMTNQLQRG